MAIATTQSWRCQGAQCSLEVAALAEKTPCTERETIKSSEKTTCGTTLSLVESPHLFGPDKIAQFAPSLSDATLKLATQDRTLMLYLVTSTHAQVQLQIAEV